MHEAPAKVYSLRLLASLVERIDAERAKMNDGLPSYSQINRSDFIVRAIRNELKRLEPPVALPPAKPPLRITSVDQVPRNTKRRRPPANRKTKRITPRKAR